ncbi:MAG: hypothetical protein WCQ54_07095, partial [Clostridiaceae bacterium]
KSPLNLLNVTFKSVGASLPKRYAIDIVSSQWSTMYLVYHNKYILATNRRFMNFFQKVRDGFQLVFYEAPRICDSLLKNLETLVSIMKR